MKQPALNDFTARAFGENWWLEGDWRQSNPGARVVTQRELDAVTAQWRRAWAAHQGETALVKAAKRFGGRQ